MQRFVGRLISACLVLLFTPVVSGSESVGNAIAFSMNIHCFEDDWQRRVETILETLVSGPVNVLAFQEVCIGDGQNQATYLADRLRELHAGAWSHQLVFTHRAWDRYDEYLLIIGKGRDLPTRTGTLPASPLQRGFAAIRLGDIWFVNTHLEYHSDNSHHRRAQVDFLVDEFRAGPHVIMGDFNATPGMPELDVFSENGYLPLFPGPTYPAAEPEIAIDGFWVSPELQRRYRQSPATTMFGPDSVEGIQSDHLGVMLTLQRRCAGETR